jgi:hypothetical protein
MSPGYSAAARRSSAETGSRSTKTSAQHEEFQGSPAGGRLQNPFDRSGIPEQAVEQFLEPAAAEFLIMTEFLMVTALRAEMQDRVLTEKTQQGFLSQGIVQRQKYKQTMILLSTGKPSLVEATQLFFRGEGQLRVGCSDEQLRRGRQSLQAHRELRGVVW